MQDTKIKELLKKYQAGQATEEDIAFLESWYLQHNELQRADLTPDELLEDAGKIWNRLHPGKRRHNFMAAWPWAAAAACFLLFFYIIYQRPCSGTKRRA